MPRYFFDLFDGSVVVRDDYGDMFNDLQEAADLAVGLLADIAQEELVNRRGRDFAVAVRNGDDRDVYNAALIFRDSYPDPASASDLRHARPAISVPDPGDLIRQSRETRAATRRLVQQTRDTAARMSEALRENVSLLLPMKALSAGRA